MRIFKIFVITSFLFLLSCDKEKNFYPPSDKDGKNDDDVIVIDGDDSIQPDEDSQDNDVTDRDGQQDFDIDGVNDVDENDVEPIDYDSTDVDDVPDVDHHVPFGCGNSIKEPGEECDNGEFNSDLKGETGSTCRTDCKYARCSDSIIDVGEICDDGNSSSGDYCSADCKTTSGSCGDAKVQTNEACDKSPVGQGIGSYCSEDCMDVVSSCGDGLIQIDMELCDKGVTGVGIGPYYCSADCKTIIGACGDTTLQVNETCDDGDNNGRYSYCNASCNGRSPYCGDGTKDYGYENCDDGNNEDNDYCTPDCMTELGRCGDGVIQSNEACDKAVFGAGTGAYCSSDCKDILGFCGDETVQSNEQCDRGSKNGSLYCVYGVEGECSSCDLSCNTIPGESTFCGDGKIDVVNGESCDKAEFGSGIGAYCASDCKSSNGYCGDGAVQPNEACDKATFNYGTGPEYCASDCKSIIGFCGDGTQQTVEECDNGSNNTDRCAYGQISCTVCNTQCKNVAGAPSFCGDAGVDSGNGELCDSGANNGQYRSSYPGHCNSDCHGTGAGGYCGDENIQVSNEQCDKGSDNGKLDCTYGQTSCEVCTSTCTNASGIVKYCGDSIISNGEVCDSGANNGSYGYCKSDCTGFGERCGDGITNGTESCDDGVLNGTYGKCASDCSGPGKRCGDGIKQPEEICDDGTDNGFYRLNAPGNCNTDCQGRGNGGYCGNGSEEISFEECDHNGIIITDCEYGQTSCFVCDSNCMEQPGNTAYCGDGIKNGGETCDSGVHNGDYGYCNATCTDPAERCGDGILNGTESCDDGVDNGLYGHCKADCSGDGPYCGDDNINGSEFCDDGFNNGNYGYCNSTCTDLDERCGDGITNGTESCDDGVDNGFYGHCKADCSGDGPYCGDDDINGSEFCDDGFNNGNYGYCNATCTDLAERCGDGMKTGYEICDSGVNNGAYGYCKSDCTGLGDHCGDGIENGDEICDSGINNGTIGYCNSNCSGFIEYCGDGIINGEEQCDNGDENGEGFCDYGEMSCRVCSASCTEADGLTRYCGNSNLEDSFGEICDNGANNGQYSAAYPGICNSDCKGHGAGGYCGDGSMQDVEQCDYGANNGNTICDYGLTSCDVCTTSCTKTAGTIEYCGDSIQNGDEVCDDGEYNGKYSPWGGPYCSSDCMGMGSGGYCGDSNIQEPYEECDEGLDNGPEGICSYECILNPYCGDGNVDDGELCDMNNVNCSNFAQFSSGTASCTDKCVPDFSTCVENPVYYSPFFTTSQTECYNNSSVIACPSDGNPFFGQEPQFDYTVQNFTVDTDIIVESVSGLLWQKATPSTYSGCTKGYPSGTSCSPDEASNYCENLELGGFDDWLLPTAFELSSIMHFAKTAPLVFDLFTGSISSNYLSLGYYRVSFASGTISKTTSFGNVKCVRGSGQFTDRKIFHSGNLFVDILDSTVPQNVFWQYDSAEPVVDWEDALAYCSALTEGGVSNFRLPTVVELQSFVSKSILTAPPLVGSGKFWTSTTVHSTPSKAYSIDSSTGNVELSTKTDSANVICVK